MDYFGPTTLREALSLLSKWKGRAKIVAGSTNLIPDIRAKAVSPKALIDISRLRNLSAIKEEKKRLRIGGLTTISELASSKLVQDSIPILAAAARQLGNPLVRNRATLAGNLADASPAADTAIPLLVLEAVIVTDRPGKKGREIPIDRFFVGPNKTVLKGDEIIREVIIPRPDSETKWGYTKLGLRNATAISVVSVGILMQIEGDVCHKARIGLGAVAPTPIRAYETEKILTGQRATEELIRAAGEMVEKEVSPISDIRASAEYRRSMASVLLQRLVREILSEKQE